jgi:hypothetical protein
MSIIPQLCHNFTIIDFQYITFWHEYNVYIYETLNLIFIHRSGSKDDLDTGANRQKKAILYPQK